MRDKDRKYFSRLLSQMIVEYKVAVEAKRKRLDQSELPEAIFVWDMAERIEELIGPKGVGDFIRKHQVSMERDKLALKVVDAIIEGQFGVFPLEKTTELAVRVALAILTEGVTVAPYQGISKVVVRRIPNIPPYLSIYFAGPIRSAGGTESGLILVYADYIRRRLGLGRYRPIVTPTENEVNRLIEELRIHEREVGRFQFHVSNKQIEVALASLPVEINGIGTDRVEVVINRDMSRIKTNRVRGGALRVLNDGLIGRSKKLLYIVSKLGVEGWQWLSELISPVDEGRLKPDNTVLEAIAGRPIFSLPGQPNGFRLRYGRADNTGVSAFGLHPATFSILNYFLVTGTQIKVDYPGKGAVVMPVATISPPVVKLMDGSTIKVSSEEEAFDLSKDMSKVLWLGDILISLGDFLENNYTLKPSAYVEEWWIQDLMHSLEGRGWASEEAAEKLGLYEGKLKEIIDGRVPTFKEALCISEILEVPLHPRYLLRWSSIDLTDTLYLLSHLKEAVEASREGATLRMPREKRMVSILDSLLMSYKAGKRDVIIGGDAAQLLCFVASIDRTLSKETIDKAEGDSLKLLSLHTGVVMRDIVGSTVAARMGRPEKSSQRKMKPDVHTLFPVGYFGGSSRNLVSAAEGRERISVDLAYRKCMKCNQTTFHIFCPSCRGDTIKLFFCRRCGISTGRKECISCGGEAVPYIKTTVNLRDLFEEARKATRISPEMVKGVKGLISAEKTPENLGKALLRAFHNISVFKDGTTRFDVTNAPLTAFQPDQANLSKAKTEALGYEPVDGGRMLSLKHQDIIIPRNAAEYLLRVSRFLDDLLERLYDLPPYYKASSIEDLIGALVVGLSPHTSVGVVGRIIGFTDSQVLYAHPLWHAAKRRDCDGDQDSVMLLLDLLLNFSKKYLPAAMGGEMDAPIFISPVLLPSEVDSQAHNMETTSNYPREFYEATLSGSSPKDVSSLVPWVSSLLNTEEQYVELPSNFSGVQLDLRRNRSSYRRLRSMEDKVRVQLDLSTKLTSVDASLVAKSVVGTHLLPDLIGNLRAFTTQSFRCKRCNTIHRRLPLSGRCEVCSGELVQTVHRRSVIKYLSVVKEILEEFCDDPYLCERVKLVEKELALTIGHGERAQKKIVDYF